MGTKKEALGKPVSPPKSLQDRELERFVLWASDGGRVAEIEMRQFRPRIAVIIWQGRAFVWHDKT
jgi:hypothetical protein